MAKSFLNMPGYPLGLRNNNPGNVRPFDPWQGMIGQNQGFAVFKDISWGIRAMGKAITYELNTGNNTIAKLIYEWAPPSDGNDTEAYIDYMIGSTLFPRNQPLNPDTTTLRKLIRGIMDVELGYQFSKMITDADINEGLALITSSSVTPGEAAAGFTVGTALFLFSLYLLATMPKAKRA